MARLWKWHDLTSVFIAIDLPLEYNLVLSPLEEMSKSTWSPDYHGTNLQNKWESQDQIKTHHVTLNAQASHTNLQNMEQDLMKFPRLRKLGGKSEIIATILPWKYHDRAI